MIEPTQKFEVTGSRPLKGAVQISGSKNAALPILCAALLTGEKSVISNVPEIADIYTLLAIFDALNIKTSFKNNILTIDPSGLKNSQIPEKLICSMRASILLLGPLLAKFGEADLPFPGGCVLGKRPVNAHTWALKALGAKILEEEQRLHLKINKAKNANIIMSEASVTATENALMVAALTKGTSQIRLAATEPHVQDLCHFLNSMGAKISAVGTNFLAIEGVEKLHGTTYKITGDYLEAGTFALAAIVTGGEIEINGIDPSQLDSLWQKLNEAGANYTLEKTRIFINKSKKLTAIPMLHTAVYPSFPTDLQAPFAVLLTQADGQSNIFETLFEGRLNYLVELEKMGAKVEILNPYQARINGPTPLKGIPISSCDIRAGAAMVIAALCAEGKTEISNIRYIDRGYENLDEKLRALGAQIQRI